MRSPEIIRDGTVLGGAELSVGVELELWVTLRRRRS